MYRFKFDLSCWGKNSIFYLFWSVSWFLGCSLYFLSVLHHLKVIFIYFLSPEKTSVSLNCPRNSSCLHFFFFSCKTHLAVWCLSSLLALGMGEGSDLFLFACWLEAKGNSVCFAWLYKVRSFCILAVLGMQRQGWEKVRQKMLCWIWTLACKLLTATNEW